MNGDNKVVEKGIKWLLSQQLPDGSWSGGFYPFSNKEIKKKEDMYATAQSLFAIQRYAIQRNWI
jgi:squalene cyclase